MNTSDPSSIMTMREWMRIWFMACRPKTLTAAIVPIVIATALVKAESHEVVWRLSVFALLSAIFIQIGTNLVNDALDFKKGADTADRTGPRRVTQTGLVDWRIVLRGAFVSFGLAFFLGIPLVVHGGWVIVLIGLISLLLGYAYTGGPFPLAYKGLGDVFVLLFFGVISVCGTFYLHTSTVTISALVAGVQIGLLATALIAINNLRDAPQDKLANKKTLAVRFGITFSRIEIICLIVVPYLLGLFWVNNGALNAALLPVLGVPVARRLVWGVLREEPGPIYNRFLAMSAGLHFLFGVALAVGLWQSA